MHKGRIVGTAAVTLTLALTACSSSGNNSSASDSSGSGSSSSSSSVAAGSAPDVSTPGASSSAGSATVAQAIAEAKAAEKFPSGIPVTQALPSKPPTGKTVVYLQCEEQQCPDEGDGMDAAAKTIGWTVKTLNFKAADPATLVAALKTALQYHPVAVFFSGAPQAEWASEQAAYQAAGSYIVESSDSKVPTGPGTLPGRGYSSDYVHIGKLIGDVQIQDSNGQPANSVLLNVPDYPVFGPTAQTYKQTIAAACPSCNVTEVDITLQQLQAGQTDAAVISAIKRSPNIKYVVSVNGAFTGQLPQDLKTAGLAGQVKIISGQGSSQDQQNVLSGEQLATANSPLIMGGWQDMDMAIRTVMHLPIPQGDHELPIVLLTKDNIGTPKDSYDVPADYAQQFEKLWKVG